MTFTIDKNELIFHPENAAEMCQLHFLSKDLTNYCMDHHAEMQWTVQSIRLPLNKNLKVSEIVPKHDGPRLHKKV